VTKQCLNNDRSRIPAPGVQPVRQHAHCVTASQAEKPADPDDDPARFNQTADLARVHAVAYYLQNSFGIPGGLAAGDTMRGTKIFKSGSIRAFGAELLDSNGEAM
jgi:hypothetical protein